MGRHKLRVLRPQDQPNPSPEAVGVYFLLRAQGVQIRRSGVSLAIAFPRDDAGRPSTPESDLRSAIERNWTGLFQVACAIEAKHKVLFTWLAPSSVDSGNPFFRTELLAEPPDELRKLTGPGRLA